MATTKGFGFSRFGSSIGYMGKEGIEGGGRNRGWIFDEAAGCRQFAVWEEAPLSNQLAGVGMSFLEAVMEARLKKMDSEEKVTWPWRMDLTMMTFLGPISLKIGGWPAATKVP